MCEENLVAKRSKRRRGYCSYAGEISEAPPNLLRGKDGVHDFVADAPNRKWLTDITEFRIPAGKVYLSPVIDCFVPSTTSGASVCKLGAGGVLTDPNNDQRTWFWAHYYADGEGVLTATATPDATRELVASNWICAIGKYVGLGFTPWDGVTGPTHRQHLTSATFAADMATFPYLNLNYLFYSCTNLASVGGLGNLSGVRSMRYTFSSCAFTTIDFRGFDPSTLTDLFCTFSGCSKLTTILADATWVLPTSGLTGSQCFYSCSTSLVGGNGTVWASNKTAYTYLRIDTESTPGYITVA